MKRQTKQRLRNLANSQSEHVEDTVEYEYGIMVFFNDLYSDGTIEQVLDSAANGVFDRHAEFIAEDEVLVWFKRFN